MKLRYRLGELAGRKLSAFIRRHFPNQSAAAARRAVWRRAERRGYRPDESEAVHPHVIGNANVDRPSKAGELRIVRENGVGTLCGSDGKPIQLRGMSTHGLHWYPAIVNDNAFAALASDWEANVIRLTMYVGENGYASDPSASLQRVLAGIELAIANDLYVIVDWHVHLPGDPNAELYKGARDFFAVISGRYPNNKHLIYELANEPNSNAPGIPNNAAGWRAVKAYAEPLVEMLRASGNDNLIIVGSPNWSQRPDLAANDPILNLNTGLPDTNTAYALHFYAGTHQPSYGSGNRQNVMCNARYALKRGVVLFVTEWGTSIASGQKGTYLQMSDAWLDFLNRHQISWINWSLTNKNEASAVFKPYELGRKEGVRLDPGPERRWELADLTVSGEYVRARMKGIRFEPIDRTLRESYTTVLWSFDKGTAEVLPSRNGGMNGRIAISNDNGALKLSREAASEEGAASNYRAEVRLSLGSPEDRPDIRGAERLTLDVLVASPTTVGIAALLQSAEPVGRSPANAVQAGPSEFVKQPDGAYKARLAITKDDAPGLAIIAEEGTGGTLSELVLFLGAAQAEWVALDNIAVTGSRAVVDRPVSHAPLGRPTLPADFANSTRGGWDWDAESGIRTSLEIQYADGHKTISWEAAYPDVKPYDGWASAARLVLGGINAARGGNRYVFMELYLKPVRAGRGHIAVHLAFAPPELNYWAQAAESCNIALERLSQGEKTADGLYLYKIAFDLDKIGGGKKLAPDTVLRDLIVIVADVDCDFIGRMYMSNVRFGHAEAPAIAI